MYIKNVKIIFVIKLNEDEHKQSHFVHFWGKTLKFLTEITLISIFLGKC